MGCRDRKLKNKLSPLSARFPPMTQVSIRQPLYVFFFPFARPLQLTQSGSDTFLDQVDSVSVPRSSATALTNQCRVDPQAADFLVHNQG
jgi:hypothetical protein